MRSPIVSLKSSHCLSSEKDISFLPSGIYYLEGCVSIIDFMNYRCSIRACTVIDFVINIDYQVSHGIPFCKLEN